MEDKIVTLETYIDFMAAEMDLGKLQTAGISCFIDENAAGVFPLFSNNLGAYKIKVFERDLKKCRELLKAAE